MDNQGLKPINLVTNCATDGGVLRDLLRCYGYGLQSEAVEDSDLTSTFPSDQTAKAVLEMARVDQMGVCAPAALDRPPLLQVAWDRQRKSLRICWQEQVKTCSWEEEVRPFAFEETRENRRRRVLRLAFHHLLLANQLARPNPWGILTGVRPTKIVHRFLDQGLKNEEIRRILDVEYGIEPTRIDLIMATTQYQRPYLLCKEQASRLISLYIGFPFCPSRCHYCSFPGYDLRRWHKWEAPCLQAMLREIQALGAVTCQLNLQVQTLYFGGGTPTAMSPEAMDQLLTALSSSFNFLPQAEWTIEGGRPETLTPEMLTLLAKHPVSRICINPQTMQQTTLDQIGRKHSVSQVTQAFADIRSKVGNSWSINSDLILGLPDEALGQVEDNLDQLLALKPENITLHGLSIKRGSAFKEEQPQMLNGAAALAMGDLARRKLTEAGYVPYYLYRQKESLAQGENIGYTLPGKQCLYNIQMMEERQTILGLGVGAGSKFLDREDWSLENSYNPKDLIQYIQRIEELIQRKVDKLAQIS